MLMGLMLLTGCATGASYGTESERAVCDVLRPVAPSFSSRDTPETLEGGKRFYAVFDAVCG